PLQRRVLRGRQGLLVARFRGQRWQAWFLCALIDDEILGLKNFLRLGHRDVDLDLLLGTGTNELAAREYENHDPRFIHAVDESWKLLRLIHGLLQSINRCLSCAMSFYATGGDNILIYDLWPTP